MPRRPRSEHGPGLYHVTARGNRRQQIYLAESDVARFLAGLDEVVKRYRWTCYAFCLLPNHYHLLLETTQPNLGDGMRDLNGPYAQWFNRRYGLGGHLFQDRFHSAAVENDSHLLELTRYIALNPVRAGLCGHPADWPWGSYRATVGRAPKPAFLAIESVLGLFSANPRSSRQQYASFVRAAPVRAVAAA
jgi:putative transposase